MKIKPLLETNPYFKNAAKRKWLIERSVRTSCGVEGIIDTEQERIDCIKIPGKRTRKIYQLLNKG